MVEIYNEIYIMYDSNHLCKSDIGPKKKDWTRSSFSIRPCSYLKVTKWKDISSTKTRALDQNRSLLQPYKDSIVSISRHIGMFLFSHGSKYVVILVTIKLVIPISIKLTNNTFLTFSSYMPQSFLNSITSTGNFFYVIESHLTQQRISQ